jgi:tRNA threonylcarbamoyladenosine biosynthesis protein TsaE
LSATGRESIIGRVSATGLQLLLDDSDATEAFGRALAHTRPERAIVFLRGDLGAGKSTLARALLRALGVQGPIRSPTYTLVERYQLADGSEALHLDLYRIGDAGELEFLGLADADAALWLVEWPERGAAALPAADLVIELAFHDRGRAATVRPESAAGQAWLGRLQANGRLRALPSVI